MTFGDWEVFIGGIFLILTAILNPDGIAGGIRRRAEAAKLKRATKSEPVQVPVPAT